MTIGKDLTPKLQKLVLRVEDDLRARLEEDRELKAKWQSEHADALHAERTSSAWVSWRDDRITQAAVGWVLTTVFLRFCEDNALLSKVWISGPGARRQEAFDAENAYFRAHPENTWREWILKGITHLRSFSSTAALVDEHAALWQVSPSGAMAKEILDFWRATDEAGFPLYSFQDNELSTRFLGDLYQDLSEYAKKTFALLQTPEFVEEFILDQTLTPALAERPLEGFKLIDPTCGSGHFLLGGFRRLLDEWNTKAPNLEPRERVQKALNAIHGVDLNPFAVAIARFRLTIAALQATGELDLERAPDFSFHLAAGDSLLFGRTTGSFEIEGFDLDARSGGFAYSSEDRDQLAKILADNQYDAVVGNPPYITVKDKTLNKRYRKIYSTCKGTYALTVPFMERFFSLARHGVNGQPAGWTGQITSNSFMKREFGSKLIEDFLAHQDLRLVADTSGAFIPGHGTPTVIIIGRHQHPVGTTVRAALGLRGEPGRPEDPEHGFVWQSITRHIDQPGHEDSWITITNLERTGLAAHPWSLSGGGAASLLAAINTTGLRRIDARRIGKFGIIGADEPLVQPKGLAERRGLGELWSPVLLGSGVRDWTLSFQDEVMFPYDNLHQISHDLPDATKRWLWPFRVTLNYRSDFNGTYAETGKPWFGWHQLPQDQDTNSWAIAWAEVATLNHFVLLRDRLPVKQTALIIKLSEESTEDDHLALLGILNSSTVCFWLKQNCFNKGNGGIGGGIGDEDWEPRYQFNAVNIADIPIPFTMPVERGKELDLLAQAQSSLIHQAIAHDQTPSAEILREARSRFESIRQQMIARQEELDWAVYGLYEFINDDMTYEGDDLPQIKFGERAFEIALGRRIASGEEDTAWFSRHGCLPISEIPTHWPAKYRELVQRRLNEIESNPQISLLEKPENKRRWAADSWPKQQESALQEWLLSRLENSSYWFDFQGRPVALSVSQLADLLARDPDFVSVLGLWAGTVDVDVSNALTRLVGDQAVPYLAALRLKDSGLRKREAWEETWDLQRREETGESVGPIPEPPKYAMADFRKASWWQARGKLDVPKERFVLYTDAGRSTDPTLLLGWAGWDHAQQFLVLATIMDERIAEGADDAQLVPLVAGMAEVLPWVKQWHADIEPAFGMSMADFCSAQLEERMTQLNVSTTDLKAWRPTSAARGRRAVKENA
ncbi:BREX-2 system adenine-specific DNA-methyltransferase PglX [Paenarthrobacter sp. NPDC089989]|uniref:BREX-2 system adenine-specific DNA-methyltransferase PglX n=1 Tax=unclassified Paenarthrobacter TaxID=2634190 RepID=UPI00381184D3